MFILSINTSNGSEPFPYDKVYDALNAYPQIKQYRTNIENIAIREIGKKNINYAYFLYKLSKGKVSFTLKHNKDLGSFEVTKDKSLILYNIEFP